MLMQNIELRTLAEVSICLLVYLLWVSFHRAVINESPQLVYTHTFPFIPTWYYLNDSKYMYQVWMTFCPIYQFWAKDL